MGYPLERAYLAERRAFVATLETLTDDEFETGTTLCEEWAPRDVLAHLLGIDRGIGEYVRSFGNIGKANARLVERYRSLGRDELMAEANRWADQPSAFIRPMAAFFLGDLAMHHQDVLRGLGRSRELDPTLRRALLREGVTLGGLRLLRYRVVPDDGLRPLGRGTEVRGSSEALALWLAGRKGIEAELEFGPSPRA